VVIGMGWGSWGSKIVWMVQMGLVPRSPNTTPSAPITSKERAFSVLKMLRSGNAGLTCVGMAKFLYQWA
jgi:hypothetical protein